MSEQQVVKRSRKKAEKPVEVVTIDPKWLELLAELELLTSLKDSHEKFVAIWNKVKKAININVKFGEWLLANLPKEEYLWKRVNRVVNPTRNNDAILNTQTAKVYKSNLAYIISLLEADGYKVVAPRKK